jgi:pyruvate-ferredoxin/flavodoxin oxidoreductase
MKIQRVLKCMISSINEAESYYGPSLIIAYTPCISHGIKQGMGKSQGEEKRAVQYREECFKNENFRLRQGG